MAKRVDEQIAPWEDDSSATVAIDPTEPAPLSEFDEFASPDPWDATEDDVPLAPEKEPLVDEIASEFVGFWNALVSKTNWEKGKVIHSWRVKLIDAGVPRRIYSDEAIAKQAAINGFLRQGGEERSGFDETLAQLRALAG